MKPLKTFFTNIIISCISIVILFTILEISTRFIWNDEHTNWIDFRKSRPKPYQKSDFFSKKFIEESFTQPGKWINPEGTRIIYPENYKGNYFNVENHYRVTTDCPEIYSNKIYLFGGSTVYCSEVPDEYTVASYLQRDINRDFPNQYQVINCGVTSINTMQQLEKLKHTEILPKDIVIFYGGVNDGLLFTTGRPTGWIMGENLLEFGKLNYIQKLRFKIYSKLHKKSVFVERFLNPYSYKMPEHMKDTSKIQELQKELLVSFQNSIISAESVCKKNKASFFNFIQPCIYTRMNNTPYENELINNKYIIPEAWMSSLKYSYPILIEANGHLRKLNIQTEDLSSIFNNSDNDYYLDYVHVTEKGNEIIASEICKKVFIDLEN
jgi:lysophospholipase L1-like esterase